jgi:hypothetical protein
MRLVNGKERDLHPLHHLDKTWGRRALRRHIEKVELAAIERPADLDIFLAAERRVERRRPDAETLQGLNLVAHQGNQRRNDNADARPAKRRYLETERFSRARRKQHHGIAAGHDMRNHLRLAPAKSGIAIDTLQDGKRTVQGRVREERIGEGLSRHDQRV